MYQKFCTVKIVENEHTISFPNVGQQLEIESLKILLSDGTYRKLAETDSIITNRLLNLIDAFSTFCIMLPELKLEPKEFKSIDPVFGQQLTNSFLIYNIFCQNVYREINEVLLEKKK